MTARERVHGNDNHLQGVEKFATTMPLVRTFDPHEVEDVYDRRAFEFLQHRKGESWYFRNVVQMAFVQGVNDHLRDGGVLADLHCGTGYLSHVLVQFNNINPDKVIGVDISSAMLEIGREQFSEHHANLQVEFLHSSVSDMSSIRDNTVDVAVSSYGFDYTPPDQIPGTFREVNRILKPGGRLVFLIPSEQRCQEYYLAGLKDKSRAGHYPEGVYYETTRGLAGEAVPKTYWRWPRWLSEISKAGLIVKRAVHPMPDNNMLQFNDSLEADEANNIRTSAFLVEKPVIYDTMALELLDLIAKATTPEELNEVKILAQSMRVR